MIKPITPKEAHSNKVTVLPDKVLEAFNELITKNYHEGTATVLQKDVVKLIQDKMELKDTQRIFNEHWLDVEDVYRDAGWFVVYDKPCYYGNDDYYAYFKFSKRK